MYIIWRNVGGTTRKPFIANLHNLFKATGP